MMFVDLNTHTKVGVFQYPFSEKVNPILHNTIRCNLDVEDRGTRQTHWNCRSREFDLISNYAFSLLKDGSMGDIRTDVEGEYVLLSLWGMWYNKGEYQEIHDHIPAHWSFVYYVNTPKGSSPLVFDNKKIYPKSGDLVMFPGWLRHRIPPNKCEGRTSVVGNFYYKVLETVFTNKYYLK